MTRWSTLLIVLAGLLGSAGVALAAWAAHRSGGENLMTAALFLLLHAAPVLAIALAPPRRALLIAASILVLGVTLFSGDLSLRYIANLKPWPMAAPTGGSLLILGWLWMTFAGLLAMRR
jgi:uncharacterized membrane protein YgdD (TMEM256/DUF423 family)